MATTQFSVVITCHNQRNVISDAVESALSQTHLGREVIVVDDASSDGSNIVLKSYGDKIRLILLDKNQGAPEGRNAGAKAAKGDYVVFLDGDDALKPWALSAYDQIIQARSPVLLLTALSWFRGTFVAETTTNLPNQIELVSYNNWIEKDRQFRSCASAMVIKRTVLESIGGWSKDVWPYDDQYLAAELAYSGRTIQILNPPTVNYRVHSANTIHNVPVLIAGCYRFVAAWAANDRFFGKPNRLTRSALIGGTAFWAVKKAFRAGKRVEGLRLFLTVWPWVAATAALRLRHVIFGRRHTEFFPVSFPSVLLPSGESWRVEHVEDRLRGGAASLRASSRSGGERSL
jgi:glycosyltransferase involved in cell wall biosynthesis